MIYSKVCIIGRPNVGKSCLFNRIIGRRSAIVSPEAGVTRDRHDAFVFWKTKKFLLVDTGGLEFSASDNLDQLMREQIELAVFQANTLLCVFDGAAGVRPADHEVVQKLRQYGKEIFWVVNKIDDPRH